MQAANCFALQRNDVVYVILNAVAPRYEVAQAIHGRDSSLHLFVEPRRRGALFTEPSFLRICRFHPWMIGPPLSILLPHMIAILGAIPETRGHGEFGMLFLELSPFTVACFAIFGMICTRLGFDSLCVLLIVRFGINARTLTVLGVPCFSPCSRFLAMG